MSMPPPPPPDRPPPPPPGGPTEPLRRTRAAPVVEERVVAPAVDPNVILLRLEDAIDALRTWVFIIGLVALVALGIALYAVLSDEDTTRGDRGGSRSGLASDERVSAIENRVDRISRQVQDLRVDRGGSDDAAALAGRVDDLERRIRSQPATGGTQQAVDELSSRIDELATDIDELKAAQP